MGIPSILVFFLVTPPRRSGYNSCEAGKVANLGPILAVRRLLRSQVIETIACQSVDEFLALMRRSNDRWMDQYGLRCGWVFRGVGDASFELTPTAWRESASHSPLYTVAQGLAENVAISYLKRIPHRDSAHVKHVVLSTIFEWQCIWNFAEIADELGFRVPGGKPSFDYYSDIFPYDGAYDMEIHPCAALARHHQMPSRLLDWSNDPMVAAYMSTADETCTGDIAVYALRRNVPQESKLFFYHVERCDMGYLHRQDGLFTYVGDANRYYVDNGKWPQLASLAGDENLVRITLPRGLVPLLRKKLTVEKYTKAHLMPTFDNISESVNGLWSRTLREIGEQLREQRTAREHLRGEGQ